MNCVTKAVDWAAIEAECRNSGLAISAIARKHGVSENTVHKRSSRGGWRRLWVRPDVLPPRESEADCLERPHYDSLDSGEGKARPRNGKRNGGVAGVMPDPEDSRAIPLHRALVQYVNTRHQPGSKEA